MVGFEETLGQYEEYLLASREFIFPDHFVMLWINFAHLGGGGVVCCTQTTTPILAKNRSEEYGFFPHRRFFLSVSVSNWPGQTLPRKHLGGFAKCNVVIKVGLDSWTAVFPLPSFRWGNFDKCSVLGNKKNPDSSKGEGSVVFP